MPGATTIWRCTMSTEKIYSRRNIEIGLSLLPLYLFGAGAAFHFGGAPFVLITIATFYIGDLLARLLLLRSIAPHTKEYYSKLVKLFFSQVALILAIIFLLKALN